MLGQVVEPNRAVSDDHLTEQTLAPRVVADRGDGALVEAVVHERGQLAGVGVDTEGGVAGFGHRCCALDDPLQDRVPVVRTGQRQRCAQQHPQAVRPLI